MWYTLPILEQYSRFAGVYNDVRCVMTYLKAILLGLVQGIAEFLPISSSGHLAIARNLLNMEGAGSIPEFFDVLLHLGTLIAVFAAYWGDIRDMVVEFFRGIGDLAHRSTPTPVPPARRLILLIIVGTLPLFAVLPIRKTVQGLGDNMYFVGAALIFTGFLSVKLFQLFLYADRVDRPLMPFDQSAKFLFVSVHKKTVCYKD